VGAGAWIGSGAIVMADVGATRSSAPGPWSRSRFPMRDGRRSASHGRPPAFVNILFLTHRLPYSPNRGDRVRAFHLLHEMAEWARVDLVSLVHDEQEIAQPRPWPL
jgi:hypothetical protein